MELILNNIYIYIIYNIYFMLIHKLYNTYIFYNNKCVHIGHIYYVHICQPNNNIVINLICINNI